MNLNLLCLDSNDISDDKIVNEYIPLIIDFLFEIYDVRQKIQCTEKKEEVLAKFKLIIDMISIYKYPDISNLLKNFQNYEIQKNKDEKQRLETLKIREIRKQEYFRRREKELNDKKLNNLSTLSEVKSSGCTLFDADINAEVIAESSSSSSSSSEDKMNSDISEDEYKQNEVSNMLDQSYEYIKNKGILKQKYFTERTYTHVLDNTDNSDESDVNTDTSEKDSLDDDDKNKINNNEIDDNEINIEVDNDNEIDNNNKVDNNEVDKNEVNDIEVENEKIDENYIELENVSNDNSENNRNNKLETNNNTYIETKYEPLQVYNVSINSPTKENYNRSGKGTGTGKEVDICTDNLTDTYTDTDTVNDHDTENEADDEMDEHGNEEENNESEKKILNLQNCNSW